MKAFFAFVALIGGFFLAITAFGVIGGILGVAVGVAVFVGFGWVMFAVLPAVGGAFTGTSSSYERGARDSGLLDDDDDYHGDIRVVYMHLLGNDKRTMGRFGTGNGAMYLGSSSYGRSTGTTRIEVAGTIVHPLPSKIQQGSWDVHIYQASDLDAYDSAAANGDTQGMLAEATEIALLVVQPQRIQEFHRLMRAALETKAHGSDSPTARTDEVHVPLDDQPADSEETASDSTSSSLRTHYGEYHDWHNPTKWGGMMDFQAFYCSICGMISQQPSLDSEIGDVPVIVLKPSPVGMKLDPEVPDRHRTITDTIEGDWEFPEGCDVLVLEGVINGVVRLPAGKSANVTGRVGGLVIDGGSATVEKFGVVRGDVEFIDGHLLLVQATVTGALITDVVHSMDDFTKNEWQYAWRPNGLYEYPQISINFEAHIDGGIRAPE